MHLSPTSKLGYFKKWSRLISPTNVDIYHVYSTIVYLLHYLVSTENCLLKTVCKHKIRMDNIAEICL